VSITEPASLDDLSIAIAHWRINGWGGAEYLVTHLANALDREEVYTLGEPTAEGENPYGTVEFTDITSSLDYSWLRRIQHSFGRVFEYAMWEDIDWREFGNPDILVTSGATTRAAITPDNTLHINYSHSPPRWFYDLYHDRKQSATGRIARPLIRYLRLRDTSIDPRVDYYLANSPVIARRLWKYHKRDAEVLYPPVELDQYYDTGDEGYFLHIGRLDAEKGVPAIIDAFHDWDKKLVLVGGEGDISASVRDKINQSPVIDYRGFVDEANKRDLLASCRAVVFNGRNEDFGIVPIEANASGKPCLARNEGFPAIFIEEGQNGYLHAGTSEAIRDAIKRFEAEGIEKNPSDMVADFSLETFEEELKAQLWNRYQRFNVV
jgi:glycosyltransferase involved in cell wall biosynthesis